MKTTILPVAALAASLILTAPPSAHAQDGAELFAQSFDVGANAVLEVDVADADVSVASHRGAGVEVRVVVNGRDGDDGRELFEAMRFEATAMGNTLRVRATDPQMGRDWWQSGRWASVTIAIAAPEGSALDVRTGDGDIQVADFVGPVSLRSSDGDVTAGRLSGERVEIETSDGDIRVGLLEDAETSVRTGDGDVELTLSGGSLQASSGDGDVWVELDDPAAVRLRTGDGDVTIRAPATLAAELDLDGEDLDVDGAFRLQGRIRDDRVTGSLNGGGPMLEARTGDGTITLEAR
jgi:hypothetical protein